MAPRKRSRHVALLLAGATLFTLSACREDEPVDAQSFPDLESCIAASKQNSIWFTEDDCRKNFAAAEKEYAETAPRYNSKELCEAEHGAGQCGADPAQQVQNSGGGGGIFMPMLTGFLLGSMLSRGGGLFSQPMVRTADGRFSTPAGNQTFATNRGTGKVPQTAFAKSPTTIGKPPLTPAQVQQRGGFGRSATSRPGGSAIGRTGGTGVRSYGG